MSKFTDFIQTELPLRPYLANDVQKGSVIIRNGDGPRQLSGIKLLPGQIIMNIEGTLQAVNLEDVTGNTDNHVHVQETPSVTWTIEHGGETDNFTCSVYDENGKPVIFDDITPINSNSFSISFAEPTIGKAVVLTV